MRSAVVAAAVGAAVLLLTCEAVAAAGGSGRGPRYEDNQAVPVWAVNVGPFNNPSEVYAYYSLPYCAEPHPLNAPLTAHGTGEDYSAAAAGVAGAKKQRRKKKQNLGEALVGAKMTHTPYEITFKDDVSWRSLCEVTLSAGELQAFKDAVEDDYYFELFVNDLPMWGYVGEVEGEEIRLGSFQKDARVFLYPHLHFHFGYNADQIVSVNVTTLPSRRVEITDPTHPMEVTFSYSVQWSPEKLAWSNRMSRYAHSAFLPETFEIHWLSVINSFVLVLLLTAFLTIILLRVLKNDFSKYMEVDEEDLGEEETGWKLIHGDVFRLPGSLSLFTAMVGAGAQIGATTGLLLACVLLGLFRATKRGALLTAIIMLYALCGFVGGFVSGRLYRQFKGDQWAWNIVLTAFIFPAPLVAVFVWVNSIAWNVGSTAALPAMAVTIIAGIFLFITFPLTLLGGLVGRNSTSEFRPPCRTTKVPRQIPGDIPWYRQPPMQMFMGGFLPFSAIYIELHYIFASVWGHKIYTLFGILVLAFVMLLIVTSFITISLTYFQLAREDHRWWWRSFFNGGSTGCFILAYSFLYYFQRSAMSGVLQGSFFFGYMSVISYGFFLMLGSIGFASAFGFVRYIFSSVKLD